MPKSDASRRPTHSVAFGAFLGELVLVALDADDGVATGNEALGANRLFALGTSEALLVPGTPLVLVLAHRRLERLAAAVATSRELLVEAVRAEDGVVPRGKGPVRKRALALHADEAGLVPMTVLEREILQKRSGRLSSTTNQVSNSLNW